MKHRILCCGVLLLCVALCSGCWDYQGMDEINIVAGVAVDQGENDGFKLTLELVNVANMKEGSGAESILVSSEGFSIFEAVRNAKKKLYNKLYFGSMRTIIISQELARQQGILDVVDGFLRDVEPRETIVLVISQEDSAQDLIEAKGLDATNVCYEIAEIIEDANKVDATSKKVQLYEAYNVIYAKGMELVLPAFHLVDNHGEGVPEINGIATFDDDKLIGFLSPEETHYFLITTNNKVGGALSYQEFGDKPVSLEIYTCNSEPKLSYSDGRVSILVTVKLDLGVVEFPQDLPLDEGNLSMVKAQLDEVLGERICEVFLKVQKDMGNDIYGYGNRIYEDQYDVWREIGDQWPALFQEAEFRVKVNADIVNAGLMS